MQRWRIRRGVGARPQVSGCSRFAPKSLDTWSLRDVTARARPVDRLGPALGSGLVYADQLRLRDPIVVNSKDCRQKPCSILQH